MAKGDALDPSGLIAEAYKIEGISAPECRSIFLDWALGYKGEVHAAVAALMARHAMAAPDHPMTQTLRAGLEKPEAPKRRGGRAARLPQ
ncbi:MAG: hypothetical protein ACSHW1_20725 [Yoonia sp.]|uniref:hypothetical protein n=1 Tax=Yoonia sp. TaxID=2212373 RepID=UPI003EF8A5D7